jgi:hypothetical protein
MNLIKEYCSFLIKFDITASDYKNTSDSCHILPVHWYDNISCYSNNN